MNVNAKCGTKAFIAQHYKYLAIVFIVLFSQSIGLYRNMDRIRNGSLVGDYDGYWHLLRAREIHDSGNWDNEINFRGNAPFGERIHWTHAMDIVLLAGAYIGSLFTDFDSSLYWFGVLVGPLFFLLSLAAIIFFGRAVLGEKHGVYLALLFAVNSSQSLVVYAVGRPDHHCLVSFLFILYYYSFILLLKSPGSTVLALLTGMLGALGIWSGLELIVVLGLSVLYLGILWIIDGDKYLKANFLLTLAVSVGISITVLMDEKPGNYLAIAYDKRSIVHVTLFALIMLYWLAVIFLGKFAVGKEARSRLITAVGGGVLLMFVCLSLFPGIISGPLARMDPRLHALYLDRTGEFSTNLGAIVYNLLLIGPGLVYLLVAVCKGAAQENRIVFSWLILTVCIYSLMASTVNRWVFTLQVVSLLPNALLLLAMSKWPSTVKNTILALLVTCSLLILPILLASLLTPTIRMANKDYDKEREAKLTGMLSFLKSQDHTTDHKIVLADIFIGPAIIYSTSLDVVGTPNHNNDQGILDTYRIVTAEDDSIAKAIVDARGIDYILVDDKLKKFAKVRMDQSGGSEEPPADAMFINRLTDGQIPDWLVRVPLPEELADTFWLYRVVEKNVKEG